MYKILIVDDEPFILEGLRHVISWEEHGLEIAATAANGVQALEILRQCAPDIVLTDIKMPYMDGLSLLKEIRREGMDIRCIFLSGYDDFEYVREAAKLGIENYLLKPVIPDELSATILNAVEKINSDLYKKLKSKEDISILRDSILYRWVSGSISSTELIERSSMLDIDLECDTYTVCLVRLLKSDDRLDPAIRNSLLDICNEETKCADKAASFFDMNGDIVLVFPGQAVQGFEAEIQSGLESILSKLSLKHPEVSVFITVGSCETDCMAVANSFSNAKNLMDYSLILPPCSIVNYNEISRSSMNRKEFLNFDFNGFKEMLTSKKYHEGIAYVDHIYNTLRNTEGITPSYLRSISIELLYVIINIFGAFKVDIREWKDYGDGIFTKIMLMTNIEELSSWIKKILVRFINLAASKETEANPLIQRIISLIDREYRQDLSLKRLSAAFNINAAYLGQLFKNETGEMFSNYLNRVRIEKAKELLMNTNLTLNDISEKVGYANVTYFYNIFKKYAGENPTKYKRDLQI